MELRPYQKKCLEAMDSAFKRGITRQLVVCATGLGKSLMAANFALQRGGNVFALSHRDELIKQMEAAFLDVDADLLIGVEKARQLAYGSKYRVVLSSVQTVGRNDGLRLNRCVPSDWPKTVITDEVHHAPAASYLRVLDYFGLYGETPPNRNTVSVGLTATPDRLDKLGYDKIFDDVVFRYGLRDGIKDNWLADIRAWRIRSQIDLSDVRTRGGDFVGEDLERVINTVEHNKSVADNWAQKNSGKLWSRSLFFCVTKAHAWALAGALEKVGAKAAVVVDDTPAEERASVIAQFQAGAIHALVNVGVFTEGFDLPEIDSIHIVRPTKSRALFTQMVGRGTRKAPGKDWMNLFEYTGQSHDICSIGQIFGLSDAWDLEGQSVLSDAEELEEAVSDMGISVDGLKSLDDLRGKLKSKAHRMQLIKSSLVAADIASSLVWVQPSKATERYVIAWRNETKEQVDRLSMQYQVAWFAIPEPHNLFGVSERLEVWMNELGKYEAKIYRRKDGITAEHPMGTDTSLAKLVGRLEGWMHDKRPHKVGLLDKTAKWGTKPASEKQVEVLRRRGIPKDFLEDGALTKREASILMGLPKHRVQALFS